MQMWTGGEPGHSHIADYLTLLHALAGAHREPRQMAVQSAVLALVLENNDVTIAILPPRKLNHSIGRRANAGSSGRCVVNAFVRTPGLQHGMKPGTRKSRSNAGKFKR